MSSPESSRLHVMCSHATEYSGSSTGVNSLTDTVRSLRSVRPDLRIFGRTANRSCLQSLASNDWHGAGSAGSVCPKSRDPSGGGESVGDLPEGHLDHGDLPPDAVI